MAGDVVVVEELLEGEEVSVSIMMLYGGYAFTSFHDVMKTSW